MRKEIASRLNEVARTMPTVFEWKTEQVPMKGWELKLTPLDSPSLVDDVDYLIEVPCMVAVEHRKQLKDAYNRGGMDEVVRYHKSVIEKIKK